MNVEVRATKLGRKVAHSSSELQRKHVVARSDPCTALHTIIRVQFCEFRSSPVCFEIIR